MSRPPELPSAERLRVHAAYLRRQGRLTLAEAIDLVLEASEELAAEVQHLVNAMDDRGLLEDHCYTFPNGDIVWATGWEPR